jgi:gamma-glutamylcyclotransferase (GGCT)/AIG2-like uncharacterized protein YtfP/lysophospholipase L1-like esterase
MAKLFVYGTLMQGQCRAHVLREQKRLCSARTEARYLLYDTGTFPAMVTAESGVPVEGEVWEVTADCLRILDGIEGAPDLYTRETVHLQPPAPQGVQAYLYRRPTTGMALCGHRWVPAGSGSKEPASVPDVPLFVAEQGDPAFSRLRSRIHIVCVGDSITGWNNFGSPQNWPYPTYPRFLQLLCSPRGLRVADGGIAGEVSPAGPRHVTRYLSCFANASWFIVGFGTNDLGMTNDVPKTSRQIVDHMQSMASLVAKQQHQVLFLNVPHVHSHFFPSATATQLRRDREFHNRQLRDLCDSEGIPLVDICSRLKDEHFGDAVHPNEAGARIIAEAVFETLSPLLAHPITPQDK